MIYFAEVYQYFVWALYNLVYVQALTVMTCKFTEGERAAWRSNVKDVSMSRSSNIFKKYKNWYMIAFKNF